MPDNLSSDLPSRLEQAAANERGLLQFLLENIGDRIYFKDRESHFNRISRAMAKWHGVEDPSQLIGKTDFDLFTPEHAELALADEQQIMRTGEPIVGKVEKETHPDGTIHWALTTKMPLRNALGEMIGTCGISKDISDLKETEEGLQAANARLATQTSDLENALREVNTAHDQLYAAHEELKTAQQRIVELESVRWIARLAFGVAHEIRNPLGTLEMGVGFLMGKKALADVPGVPDTLNHMSEAVQMADLVISALMDGAASSGVAVDSADIAATVARAVELMKSRRHEGA